MISVTEAKQIISTTVTALNPVTVSLLQSRAKILAADVYAMVDIPAFPQSAMDGYAFAFADLKNELIIDGEMAAGSSSTMEVTAGKAIRIFTGAPVPAGADTVVMQEKVKIENGILIIEDEKLQHANNVRSVGSEIKAGELALPKGTMLTAAAIGFLAGIGITEVSVIPDPVISIILTGNELQEPGKALAYGQVYESNSYSLTAALASALRSSIWCSKILRMPFKVVITNTIDNKPMNHHEFESRCMCQNKVMKTGLMCP